MTQLDSKSMNINEIIYPLVEFETNKYICGSYHGYRPTKGFFC